MNEHLTAEHEAEIRNREKSATPGPWGIYFDGVVYDVASQVKLTNTGFQCRRAIARLDDEPIDNDPAHRDWTAEQDAVQVYHDATFVARSRSDVPALLTEVDRLRAELGAAKDRLDHFDRHTLPRLRREIEHHQDGKKRWRDRAEKAEARVSELERPAVEAKRGEVRQSYREMAAQAREDRDYEGEAQALHALEAREIQWAREDEKASTS